MKPINYLGSCRKHSALSQGDVAHLVGKPSISTISKMEDNQVLPDIKTAFSFALLYQKKLCEIFAKYHEDCSLQLLRNIDSLSAKYDDKCSTSSLSKNELRKYTNKQDYLKSTMNYIKNSNTSNYGN